ncbi:UDP-glycosyltransferase 87A1-like isoform X1 [Phoenix dactylifera]|uniref:Glycosyltransferase n=1 Tax=Phoenix dactylifera TaxID=42345 RepID=A0A8B7BZG1_PHODC|nr:UDP-glycosyltransferase 87A1-like isoform X1 [Phoenix dactylifera]
MSPPNLDASGASTCCHVVAMPYPGRGHINPMMALCRPLAARGVAVTFVVTEEWLGLLQSSPAPPPGVRLRTIPNVIPSEKGRAADFNGFLEAVYTKMEDPVEQLLDRLEPPVTAIVADTYLPWAVALGNRRNIPVISLFTMSASFFSVLYHFDRLPVAGDRPLLVDESDADEPLEQFFPCLASVRLADFRTVRSVLTLRQALEAFSWVRKAQCVLFTSFYEIEACVIDALRAELSCPVYPVGPSIPYMTLEEKPKERILLNGSGKDYFDWLDSQPKSSVLYVSLGSFLSVSSSQMDEIAMGLRSSETRFLWVARGDSSQVQEMSGVMGLVVPWCDQLKVLCHPSVGGFLTHCGWNSTLEGMFTGVPMLTFPISWDQPPNSRLIVDEWKVGLSLKEMVRKDEVVGREEIAKTIKRFMEDTVENREMRRRAAELREASHRAIQDGGSSWTNFNSFVRDLLDASITCSLSYQKEK